MYKVPDAEQLFRRIVFNVVGRICDDHTKKLFFQSVVTISESTVPSISVSTNQNKNI